MKTLSIVIPVYNEEKFIEKTLSVVCSSDSSGLEKEIIVIDDGSKDQTQTSIEKAVKVLKQEYKNISFKTLFKK